MATFRRQKYFVERGLQLRFARFVILFVVASSFLTGLTIFYTPLTILGERLAQVYPQGKLQAISHSAYIAFIINFLVLLPIIFYGAIRFSHRIAGPLPKIYNTLREIGKGDFEKRVVLRKNDELKELADAINEMVKDLKEREKNR